MVVVTETSQCTLPMLLLTVAIQVVSPVGCTTTEPELTGVTFPTPLSIEMDVAFLVSHDKVTDCPNVTVVAFACR